MLAELAYSNYKGRKVYRYFDTISSISSGMTNIIKDVLGLAVIVISYQWMYQHFSLFDIRHSVLLYVLAFIFLDFSGYWSHRISHEINIFWNRHIIHHSSEEFNLACALRQSVSEIFTLFTIFLLPAACLGIPPKIIQTIAPIHLFLQFWYHTTLIGKMGWLEKIIVTPSHHRVHHAINQVYLDKNFGQIFIFWDKIFGTFKAEDPEIKPVYGVKRPVSTWNPWLINFQHIGLLIHDAFKTKKISGKIKIWFMPTGWRPEDVKAKYPVREIDFLDHSYKFATPSSTSLDIWIFFQFILTLTIMLVFFNHIGEMDSMLIFLTGIYLFTQIFTYTSLMDRSKLTYAGWGLQIICIICTSILFLKTENSSYLSDKWLLASLIYQFIVLIPVIYFLHFARFTNQNAILIHA
jgi:sterol desaturase/sphingolipid hydroxylase (fatty acid hydroxylase superfamily)